MKNIIKEAVHEKMEDMADDRVKIIYENYETTSKFNIETYIVIVELMDNRFRIYEGMKHSINSYTVKYITVEEDMFKVMTSNLNLGEV
jgi:hypothetical protein